MTHTFTQGDSVIIHSLGPSYPDKEFRAIIRGISVDYGQNPATIWIVELLDKPDVDSPYSHACIPEACLRRSGKQHYWGTSGQRFEFEGPFHIYDMVEHCYWVRESQKEIWQEKK